MTEKKSLTREEANDATYPESYWMRGANFMLPDGYSSESQPDWRLAHFSVVMPVPTGRIRSKNWVAGRFRGIKKIQISEWDESGHNYSVKKKQYSRGAMGNDPEYTPRVFHENATTHFRYPLSESVGAYAVDAVMDPDRSPEESERQNVYARRYLFEPDITSEGWEAPPYDPDQDYKEGMRFGLADKGHPFSSVALVCVEHLVYEGPCFHDIEDKEKIRRDPFANEFLVFHVVVENCSSEVLESVSKTLNRPRNTVALKVPATGWSDQNIELFEELIGLYPQNQTKNRRELIKNGKGINLTQLFAHAVQKFALPEGGGDNSELAIERGGFFSVDKDGLWAIRPYTTVVAIPGQRDVGIPHQMAGSDDQKPDGWTDHDKWAWFLATRADDFRPELIALNEESLRESRAALYHDWTIHSDENGLAVVRRCPVENHNNKLWMLTGTRFVDLAILVRRSDKYLSAMARQLRSMKFGSDELEDLKGREKMTPEDIDNATKLLNERLNKFEKIQYDHIAFRDHLWYETVPGRDVDTAVLRHMLYATGTRATFDDISSEIELRKDAYNTKAQSIRIEMEKQAAEQQREIENQSAKLQQEEQSQRDSFNLSLAFAALALSVPGLVDLLPRSEDDFWPFILSGLIIIGVLFWLYFKRPFSKKRR